MLLPGEGELAVERVGAKSVLASAIAASPLKLLAPSNHGDAVWIYVVNFGGGLVDGDDVKLRACIRRGASALVTTQSSTKVYRSPRGCSQSFDADVAEDASLVVLPDPVACFAGARYRQSTRIALAAGATLVLVDAFTCGRRAHGEQWAFERFLSRISITREERAVVVDAILLDPSHGALAARMGRFDAFATVIALGPRAREAREALLARQTVPGATIAASPLGEDGAIARVGGESTEAVIAAIRALLESLPRMLGDDPFARKW